MLGDFDIQAAVESIRHAEHLLESDPLYLENPTFDVGEADWLGTR